MKLFLPAKPICLYATLLDTSSTLKSPLPPVGRRKRAARQLPELPGFTPARAYPLAPASTYHLAPARAHHLTPASTYHLAPASTYPLAPASTFHLTPARAQLQGLPWQTPAQVLNSMSTYAELCTYQITALHTTHCNVIRGFGRRRLSRI